jgi:hypothetical protein
VLPITVDGQCQPYSIHPSPASPSPFVYVLLFCSLYTRTPIHSPTRSYAGYRYVAYSVTDVLPSDAVVSDITIQYDGTSCTVSPSASINNAVVSHSTYPATCSCDCGTKTFVATQNINAYVVRGTNSISFSNNQINYSAGRVTVSQTLNVMYYI